MSNKNAILPPLALYIHWPYCLAKCPYCDFNSHVAAQIDHTRWRAAYEADLQAHHAYLGARRLTSIFFGGGTPSLMAPETVAHVIETAQKLWTFDEDIEITLEANPTSVEAAKFKGFADAGVNRVSVGVQALNDTDLRKLGREHSAAEALHALDIAAHHFDRFSFDLIYTREGQSLSDWQDELARALPLAKAGHMSLYQLVIEPGTQFKTLFDSGRLILPDDDESARFYETTLEMTDTAALPMYEISNYAAKGQKSRHNLTYWRYGDYAGIGPGAHGRLQISSTDFSLAPPPNVLPNSATTIATRAHRAPDLWLDHVLRPTHHEAPFQNARALSPADQLEEMVLVGLRLRSGISLADIAARTGLNPAKALNHAHMDYLAAEGLLSYDTQHLRLTDKGLPLIDGILGYILT